MREASWTAAQTNFLCVVNHLSSVEILSSHTYLGVPESRDLDPGVLFLFNPLYCHKDLRLLLILHILEHALKNIKNWKMCLRIFMLALK